MSLRPLCLALSATGLLLVSPMGNSAEHSLDLARSGPATGGRVIVTYRQTQASAMSARIHSAAQASSPLREAQTLNQRHGLDLRDGRTVSPHTQVLMSSTLSSEQLRQRLSADPDIASVAIDRRRHTHTAPNDPLYAAGQASPYPSSGQWYLRASGGTTVSAINAEGAWNTTTGSSSIVVAVLDTGVRPEHPDLQGKLLPGYDFVHQVGNANDGDGNDGDPADPGDWISLADLTGSDRAAYASCSTATDSSWHGTQTAALIGAATNNGVGMASAGRHVMVLPVRVLGKCGGFDSDIIAGMRWASGLDVAGTTRNPNPAKVVNLSLGYPDVDEITRQRIVCSSTNSPYPSVVEELRQAGVVVVASAGNDDLAVNTPAQCPGIVAVAGLRHAGDKSGFSSLGREVFIAAPGGNCDTSDVNALCAYPILSATNTGTRGPISSTWSNGLSQAGLFTQGLGTSFSAPLVSATAALLLAVNPSLGPSQIKTLISDNARPFPSTGGLKKDDGTDYPQCAEPAGTSSANKQQNCYCNTTTCGAGMLDTQAAVQAAAAGRAVAHLGGTNPLVTPGSSVTIDGSSSTAASGASLASYLWELIDGGSLATITSANNASSVTLSTVSSTTSGTFTVRLTVTDSLGNVGQATQVFTLGTAPSIVTAVPVTTTTSGSGGGGGALDLSWVALGLLSLSVAWRRRQANPTRA